MQSTPWIALLKKIPAEQQNQNRPVPNTRPEQEDSVSQGREASTIARYTLKLEGAQL